MLYGHAIGVLVVQEKKEGDIMAKQNIRSAGKNHSADIKNANRGTKGTNITYDKNQGNRGKQLNSNQKKK